MERHEGIVIAITLSLRRAGIVSTPPPPTFGFSLVPILLFRQDCHSVNLPTLCPDTHFSMKKNSKNFAVKKSWGEGGL